MIIAYGMFIVSLIMLFITIIYSIEWEEKEIMINLVTWFIIALISAQYIWGLETNDNTTTKENK